MKKPPCPRTGMQGGFFACAWRRTFYGNRKLPMRCTHCFVHEIAGFVKILKEPKILDKAGNLCNLYKKCFGNGIPNK